ncbi:MAG: KH domain-containing protein [Nitrososphaerota archaeon]
MGERRITQSSFVVNIPRERVGVLIGEKGSVKAGIESRLGVKLSIDSQDGSVIINLAKPVHEGGDPASLFKARDVVTAIGRGFSPERAFKLFDEGVILSLIDISEYVGRSPNNLSRVRARLIGTGGKTRRIISETCHVEISIYGDTVSIIGEYRDVQAAEEAILALVKGAPHGAVYRMVDEYARMRKSGGPPLPR